jgi:hypothetical protein
MLTVSGERGVLLLEGALEATEGGTGLKERRPQILIFGNSVSSNSANAETLPLYALSLLFLLEVYVDPL